MDTEKPKAEWHDWVGELFEPVFGATIDDLVAHEEEPDNKPKIRHISVHDPDAVRKVYEKVHMMTKLDEEMREQRRRQAMRHEAGEKQVPEIPEQADDAAQGKVTVDLNESCIWDTNEIAILREAFKTMKKESVDSRVHVRETVKRNKLLEAKVVEQRKVIESQKLKLSEATNANRRLTIHCDKLQDEVEYLSAKVSAMEEIIKELQTEKSDMVKELHDNRVTTDKERLERERIQMKLDTLKHEALAEKLTAEDSVKAMCKKVILDLQEEVKKLTAELVTERKRHKVTEKGLKHLRQHFSSLSVQEIMPPNSVDKNQVEKIQY